MLMCKIKTDSTYGRGGVETEEETVRPEMMLNPLLLFIIFLNFGSVIKR